MRLKGVSRLRATAGHIILQSFISFGLQTDCRLSSLCLTGTSAKKTCKDSLVLKNANFDTFLLRNKERLLGVVSPPGASKLFHISNNLRNNSSL